jgi:hypothetical protein
MKLMNRRQKALQEAVFSTPSRKFDWVGQTGLSFKRVNSLHHRISLDGNSTEASSSIMTPRTDLGVDQGGGNNEGPDNGGLVVNAESNESSGPEITTVDAFVAEALRVFDEGGEVAVTAADFPLSSPWRTYVSRSQIMRSNDAATVSPHAASSHLHEPFTKPMCRSSASSPRIRSQALSKLSGTWMELSGQVLGRALAFTLICLQGLKSTRFNGHGSNGTTREP